MLNLEKKQGHEWNQRPVKTWRPQELSVAILWTTENRRNVTFLQDPHAQCIPCDEKGEDSCAGVKKKTKKGGKAKKKKKSSVSSAFGEKREQLFVSLVWMYLDPI